MYLNHFINETMNSRKETSISQAAYNAWCGTPKDFGDSKSAFFDIKNNLTIEALDGHVYTG